VNPQTSLARIDEAAHQVHQDIWWRKQQLWSGNPPKDPVALLDPGVILADLGYSIQTVECIGQHFVRGVKAEVAGIIDYVEKKVEISRRFPVQVQRFTLAHELGHAMCHPGSQELHRDVPLGRSDIARDWREIEADRFASTLLMPSRLLLERFHQWYPVTKVRLTEDVAFALCRTSSDKVREKCRNLRGLSLLVARSGYFDGRYFSSLAEQFMVSDTAMAIRLEQLGLVEF